MIKYHVLSDKNCILNFICHNTKRLIFLSHNLKFFSHTNLNASHAQLKSFLSLSLSHTHTHTHTHTQFMDDDDSDNDNDDGNEWKW